MTISNDEAEHNAKGRISVIGERIKGVLELYRFDFLLCVVRSVSRSIIQSITDLFLLSVAYLNNGLAWFMCDLSKWYAPSPLSFLSLVVMVVVAVRLWTCGVKIPLWVQSPHLTPRLAARQPYGSAGSPCRFQRRPSDRPPIPSF